MTAPVPAAQPVSSSSSSIPDNPMSWMPWRPFPAPAPEQDPTALTTQLVDRAILAYERLVNARLDGMDKATELHASNVARLADAQRDNRALLRDDVDRQLAALREYLLTEIARVNDVMRERFVSVDQQFSERDTRLGQADIERQKSLDAALAAQKEAVQEQNKANDRASGKLELSQKEQIASLTALMTSGFASMNDRITELKERQDRGEAHGRGTDEARVEAKVERRGNIDQGYVLVGLLVSIAAVIVAILLRG